MLILMCIITPTEISSLEYKSEGETSTGSVLSLYISSPSIPPLSSPSPIDSPSSYYNMSQPDYPAIMRQLQEQIMILTIQVGKGAERAVMSIKVARPQVFDGTPSKVSGSVTACRLYIKMKMKEAVVEEQIQWVLLYV